MKFPRSPSSNSGFTLVELLVVIAIIAILASVITVAAGSAINAAKRAKAANTATQIQTAIISYQTEYGVYPIPTATGAATDSYYNSTDVGDQGPLMIALSGNINASTATVTTSTVPNTRNIAYLTPKKGEVDTNGILFNPFTTAAAPQYFFIAMDSDYSGILGDSGGAAPPNFTAWTTGTAAPAPANITQPVAIWACCDPKAITAPTTSTAPNFWVHTF
jgi:prepilin-type N-terminal cleavage/methylation domain-containing protein